MIEAAVLTPDQVGQYWPNISNLLDAYTSLWEGSYSKDAILARAISGQLQFWLITEGDNKVKMFFTTQVTELFNGKKVLQIVWGIGEEVIENLPLLETAFDRFAQSMGCDTIEVSGRKGFERAFKKIGFEFQCVTLHRAVRPLKGN